MTENWKAAVGYEGRYEVSDLGGIRRPLDAPSRAGRERKPTVDRNGYWRVGLHHIDGTVRIWMWHRVVIEAFLGPAPKGWFVNHIDGNKANNAVSNLEFVSPAYNTQHAIENGLRNNIGEGNGNNKLKVEEVYEIRRLYKKMATKEIAAKFNIGLTSVRLVGDRKTWKHLPEEAAVEVS
jgi:hypothetical protein